MSLNVKCSGNQVDDKGETSKRVCKEGIGLVRDTGK